MGESGGIRRRWPVGLLGALAMVAGVEGVVARHEMDFTTPGRLEWRQSREAAGEDARGARVLGLGTSMTKLGLYSKVVERESGRSTYNLASVAGRLPGSYYLLKRALAAGAKPEAVLLEVHPTYLSIPFWDGLVAWPDILDSGESLELAWESRNATFFAQTVVARSLPSYKARSEIRQSVMAVLRGQGGSTRPSTLPHLRNLRQNDGAFVRRRDFPYAGDIHPFLVSMYLPPSWAPEGVNERYLRWTLDLCASRKIRVYWLIPPFVPELQARREQAGFDGAYNRFVRKIQDKYPGVVVLDARHSGYEPSAFSDAAHLDLPGAAVLSADVGRAMKVENGPRWVNLPAYKDRPIDAPLEDIAQSFREVSGATTLKR